MTKSFNSIQELYEDMIDNCKNFVMGISKPNSKNHIAVMGETVFSNYEFDSFETGKNSLRFWQSPNKDGANLELHNVIAGKRVGDPNTDEMFEYRFSLKDADEPFILLAFRWSRIDFNLFQPCWK